MLTKRKEKKAARSNQMAQESITWNRLPAFNAIQDVQDVRGRLSLAAEGPEVEAQPA